MTSLPDLQSLACFEAAARTLNFRAAAKSVALSGAAFSERIRRLELELGASLFERTTRRVHLTPAGHRLLPHARNMLDSARACREVVHGTGRPAPFALTIGTRFELGLSWLVPALEPLRSDRPERTLHLSFGSGEELLSRLRRGEIDALISSSRLVDPGIEYVPLHVEDYAFVASPALLAERPLTSPEQASDHVLLDCAPSVTLFRYHLDARPDGRTLDFAAHEYLGTIGAIRARVLAGAGVAVLPLYFIKDDLKTERLTVLFPDIVPAADSFRLVWPTGHRLTPELVLLGESLRQMPLK